MKKSFIICLVLFSLFSPGNILAQDNKTVIYLIPGQGADYRLFKNLNIDSSFVSHNIHYTIPCKGWSMTDYAKELSGQIDTSSKYIIIGISLGGMLATEMGDFLNPEKIIIISSTKCREKLP